MSFEENEDMFGWLICRFDRKQIHSILYGQFSKTPTPPQSGWVFLAKDAAEEQRETDIRKLSKDGLEGVSLALFAKGIDPDDLAGCTSAATQAGEGIIVNAAYLQNDRDPSATPMRYYVLRNCAIPAVNGRYMEGGFHEGAPLYRNVREWAIVRTRLKEMPELGISARGSYAIQEGSSISEVYHELAAEAYQEILHGDPHGAAIEDGTYNFKKRFIALSRAGNRMVTGDQSLQLEFVNRKRAALRSELSANLLLSLQEARATMAGQELRPHEVVAVKPVPRIVAEEGKPAAAPAGALFSRSEVLPYMNETIESCAPDTIKTSTSPARSVSRDSAERGGDQSPTAKKAPMDATEVGVEVDITLGRSISYQRAGQGYVLNRLGAEEPDEAGTPATTGGESAARAAIEAVDEDFLDAESELAREVTLCIEEREAALAALQVVARMLRRAYVEGSDSADLARFQQQARNTAQGSALSTARSYVSSSSARNPEGDREFYLMRAQPLLEKMSQVRKLTVAFSEAFGAWARLLHKQKAAKWRREKKMAEQFGGSFKRMTRSYTVVIAQRSAKELYPLSEAVQSNTKKFSRDMEPVKYATDIKLVGVFDTKEEAMEAFDKAFNAIPQEYMLLSDIKAVNKKLIGMRRCGQHYWVHSSGVPQDLECELCALQKQLVQKAAKGVPAVYKEEPVSQYLWNGQNYLEKIWRDTDFLSEVEYLQRALPEEDFRSNPLLLSNATIQGLMQSMHKHKYGTKVSTKRPPEPSAGAVTEAPGRSSTGNPRHPLNTLRGKKELARDAARAGDQENAIRRQLAHDALYANNPYNNTANFGRLDKKQKRTGGDPTDQTGEMPSAVSSARTEGLGSNEARPFLFTSTSVPSGPKDTSALEMESSEFGEVVHLWDTPQPDTRGLSTGGSEAGGGFGRFASGSLFTAPSSALRTSQSAPRIPTAADVSVPARSETVRRKPAELKEETVNAYLSRSGAAGNGAAGVKGIKSAARLSGQAQELAALSKSGLDMNRYLPADMLASVRPQQSSAVVAQSVPDRTVLPPVTRRFSADLAPVWDSEFLVDADAQRERAVRALQIIGQCPVPENALRSESGAATEPGVALLSNNAASPTRVERVTALREATTSALPPGPSTQVLSGSAPLGPSVGKGTQRAADGSAPKMTLVEAFYSYRGAQMTLLQERVAPAFRTDDTFCRSDVGEWVGFSKGRAMRAFEFKENLYQSGKRKEEERMQMQELLRAAAAVDIIHCDVPYINQLVAEARKIKGSMLALDILQAETFLRQFRGACKFALRGQCWFRGNRDRKRVAEIRRKIREQKRHRRTTEIEAAKLVKVWVPDLLRGCVEALVRKERRSVFRFTANMSSVLCMVSMRRQALPTRKPISAADLCSGCRTACIIAKWEPADRSTSTTRAPCTCIMRSQQEQWQLNIYNPLVKESTQLVLSVAQVRQMLRGIERAAKTMRSPDFAYRSLVGRDFGELQPLFGDDPSKQQDTQEAAGAAHDGDDAFNGRRLDRSFSNALLKASAESAVLTRLPLCLPLQVSHIIGTTGQHEYQASSYVRTCSTEYARLLGAYDDPVMKDGHGESAWVWHPLSDAKRLRLEIERCRLLSEGFQRQVVSAAAAVREREAEKTVVCGALEQVQMVYEDALATVVRVMPRILAAGQRIVDVMKFSKQLLEDVTMEEQGEQLDRKQSYDVLEDANAWMGLNEKRKLEKQYAALFEDCLAKGKHSLGASAASRVAADALVDAQRLYEERKRCFEEQFPVIAAKERELRELKVYTRAAADAVLQTYSMPRKVPTRAVVRAPTEGVSPSVRFTNARRVQRMPWNQVFVREPLERLRLENRGALSVLQRRVMKLVPMQATLDNRLKAHLRCVVLVLLDEVTGNMLVHVGRDAASVEESNQHRDLDLQKADFSDLTSHGLENDIILQPEDVDWILSIPVEMSAENLMRAERLSRGGTGQRGHVLDRNKLPADYVGSPAVIVPSQALRALSGVSSVPQPGQRLRGLKPTYRQRRDAHEQGQVQRAEQLLRYLRLQAHTGRPCVGLLHFRRRLAYSHKQVNACSWLSDLVKSDPLVLVNHMRSSCVLLNDTIVAVHEYSTLRRFNIDVQLPYVTHPSTIHVEIPVPHLIHSLQHQPLLLATFLWQLVTNSLSPQMLSWVTQRVDWEMPGQLDGSYWRRNFPEEIPRPHYLVSDNLRYRGPVYQRHRFVSSKYFLAELYVSAAFDLRIALKEPTDGKFQYHGYAGHTLYLHVSRAEVCAIAARVAVIPGLVPDHMLGTLLLLHPHNLHVLFVLLLELAHLQLQGVHGPHDDHAQHRHHDHHVDHGHRHHNREHVHGLADPSTTPGEDPVRGRYVLSPLVDEDDAFSQFDVAVNLATLRDSLALVFEKFNQWAKVRNQAVVPELGQSASAAMVLHLARHAAAQAQADPHAALVTSTESLHRSDAGEVPYSVKCERDPSNKQQMNVYHSVWSFLDLDRFYGDPMRPVRRQLEQSLLRARSGASLRLLRAAKELAGDATNLARQPRFPSFTLGDSCMDSLMGVTVRTNIKKTRLLIEISPMDFAHREAQSILVAHEQLQLQEEDQRSESVRASSLVSEASAHVTSTIRALRSTLHSTLLPHQERLERRAAQMSTAVRGLQEHFVRAYDQCTKRVGQKVAAIALSLITGGDGAAFEESAAAAALKAVVAPAKVPPHQSGNVEITQLAGWINDTLRHRHRDETACSARALRFFCPRLGDLQANEPQTPSAQEDPFEDLPRLAEREVGAFTTASLPRFAALSDSAGRNLQTQHSDGFRDAGRWYFTKSAARKDATALCDGNGSAGSVYAESSTGGGASGVMTLANELGSPMRLPQSQRGKRLFAMETLAKLLTGTRTEPEQPTPPAPRSMVVKSVTAHSGGVASFEVYDLQSSRFVKVYACCPAAAEAGAEIDAGDVFDLVHQRLTERRSLLDALEEKVRAIEQHSRDEAAAHALEISRVLRDVEHHEAVFCEVTAPGPAGIARAAEIVRALGTRSVPVCSSGMSVQSASDVDGADSVHSTPLPSGGKSSRQSRKGRRERAQSGDGSVRSDTHWGEVVGLLVPRDESHHASLIRAPSSAVWYDDVVRSLAHKNELPASSDGDDALRVSRQLCSFGIIYYRSETAAPAAHHHHHHHHHHTEKHHNAHGNSGQHGHHRHAANENARVSRLIRLFTDQFPVTGKAGGKVVRQHAHHVDAPSPVAGDAVIMLRKGELHLALLQDWLKAMQAEYEPQRALRLQKEGREKQWRLDHHERFRLFVCGLAFPLMRAVESLYAVRGTTAEARRNPFPIPVPDLAVMPENQTRLLLTKFDDLLEEQHRAGADLLSSNAWRLLDFFGVVDRALVEEDAAVLAHFDDEFPSDASFGLFSRRDDNLRQILTAEPDEPPPERQGVGSRRYYVTGDGDQGQRRLRTSAGQLVYCMYQLHCYNCELPMQFCSFPGCAFIRGQAAASDEYRLGLGGGERGYVGALDLTEHPQLEAVRGSGVHPVDAAIKQYFSRRRRIFTLSPPLRLEELSDTADVTEEAEAARDQAADLVVTKNYETSVKLELKWRELQAEAGQFYSLYNALVRPETAMTLTAKELLMAKGGIHAQRELEATRRLVMRALVSHSGAANANYAAYDAQADKHLLRLVHSPAYLAEQALAAADAVEKEGQQAPDQSMDSARSGGSSDGGAGEEDDEEGSESGSSRSGSGSSGSSQSHSGTEDDDDFSVSTDATPTAEAQKLEIAARVHAQQTHSIPIALLRALSTSSSGVSHALGSAAFDPYPAVRKGGVSLLNETGAAANGNAMAQGMYELLMRNLRLTRRDRIPARPPPDRPSSALVTTKEPLNRRPPSAVVTASTEAAKSDHYFRFDRLHHEQAALLQDGSAVLVQCLHGVLQGASLVIVQQPTLKGDRKARMLLSHDVFPNIEVAEQTSGAPAAAVRFLDTDKLTSLNPGMTVVVFDILSTVSRAFIIEERSLKRTCEAFGVGPEDYGGLARRIGALAHRCIQLTRAGMYCTTVMFSVASLHDEADAEAPTNPETPMREAEDAEADGEESLVAVPHDRAFTLATSSSHEPGLWASSARFEVRPAAAMRRFFAVEQLLHL